MSSRRMIEAAIQMDRDGIRRLTPKQRANSSCGHVTFMDSKALVRCGKQAGYLTPLGKSCFTHAIAQASKVSA